MSKGAEDQAGREGNCARKLGKAGGFEYANERRSLASRDHDAKRRNNQDQPGKPQERPPGREEGHDDDQQCASATKTTYKARVLASPSLVASVRLPTCASPWISRRLLVTKIAHANAPTHTPVSSVASETLPT